MTSGGASIEAAHKAAPSVPIVSLIGPDPVMMGWAKSFAKPGGMITGVFFNTQAPKRFEVLKELRPQATRFGYLMNATNPATPYMRKNSVDGARTIGVELEVIELRELSELAAAFDRLGSLGVDGVVIAADPVFLSNPAPFAELALSHKLPSVGDDPSYAKAGGLISRSANYLAIAPRCTRFVDEILKGAAPGDLAVELTVDYELTVNLKTARELGITIPPEVLVRLPPRCSSKCILQTHFIAHAHGRKWHEAGVPARPLHGGDRGSSRLRVDVVQTALMTRSGPRPGQLIAMQRSNAVGAKN